MWLDLGKDRRRLVPFRHKENVVKFRKTLDKWFRYVDRISAWWELRFERFGR